ncbi:MAG: OmpH family outer membrane protein [Bacteroidota bacterium]
MKKYIQLALMAVLVFAATATASAQKFGYVNSAEILAELPAMKAAESNLEALQKQLQKQGQAMVESFQKDYAALEEKARGGTMSPKDQQTEAAGLETRQKEIQAYEQKMVQDLQEKRATLLEPIYKDVNDAIAAVAKEMGYQFIFDQQVLLYGEEAADVSAAVKAKLGL